MVKSIKELVIHKTDKATIVSLHGRVLTVVVNDKSIDEENKPKESQVEIKL